MEIKFEKKYLEELYLNGKASDKKHRFQPDIVKRYKLRIEALENAVNIEEIRQINSFRYKELEGDKRGISSIRVNDKYRIEFEVTEIVSETVLTICNIIELSNHYK
jgi:proteic killer suppression protein